MNRQEQRAEETKRSILAASGKLFAEKGYEVVTMREIAKEANCSHTTIYIYFKDKEALLYELSMPPLFVLKGQMEAILVQSGWPADRRLKAISREMIEFCLKHRNMFPIFFGVKAGRVDEVEPELEINKLRNHLFGLLQSAVRDSVGLPDKDERLLTFSRIYYYTLHGIIGTYANSEESVDELLARLSDTFDESVDVLLAGFQYRIQGGRRG